MAHTADYSKIYVDSQSGVGLSIDEVGRSLGTSSRDLGTLCRSSLVNMWARYKPLRSSKFDALTELERRALNYGWEVSSVAKKDPVTFMDSFLAVIKGQGAGATLWGYNAPRAPGNNDRYRLLDFDKYMNNVIAPFGDIEHTPLENRLRYVGIYSDSIAPEDEDYDSGLRISSNIVTTVKGDLNVKFDFNAMPNDPSYYWGTGTGNLTLYIYKVNGQQETLVASKSTAIEDQQVLYDYNDYVEITVANAEPGTYRAKFQGTLTDFDLYDVQGVTLDFTVDATYLQESTTYKDGALINVPKRASQTEVESTFLLYLLSPTLTEAMLYVAVTPYVGTSAKATKFFPVCQLISGWEVEDSTKVVLFSEWGISNVTKLEMIYFLADPNGLEEEFEGYAALAIPYSYKIVQ